ncbi:zinc-finger homeodomain protein 7-like [Panicum virgatum]|uniref:ZF-HD dimerization-type domain-containing protein n=1 Tax=Panicum virgatum TaxID=38727 RepID=A0A8T0XRX2_PANVG|nr:zinc-finger homeodomain protein 7-like [Panicum virgatum]KAG2660936.1 hypothetical protein PVAP13_1KG469600 [Panicum virgatum]
MEYKRSSHVEEEEGEEEEVEDEEEEEEDEEEEARGHRYTTAAAAPVGAPQQQQVHAQALGLGSHASLMDAAAFSRPRLPPDSSLVTQPPLPPPGFMPAQRQPQLHPRRGERERAAGAPPPQPRRHQEGARNGVLGGGTVSPAASTLTLAPGAGAVVPVEATQWRYRECLRNHAARLGAHVLDGCCEFMPSAGDGAAALACAACGCHRSFHRREAVPGAAPAVSPSPATPTANSSRVMPLLLPPPHMQTTRPHVPVSPSSAPAALTESSSEELRGPAPAPAAAHPAPPPTLPPHAHAQLAVGGSASAPPAPSKKRFRTKFTAEQKDRMREFAHRLGWRINKPDSDAVDAFCDQVGVSRRVLKVWMHNNKHLAKMPPSPSPPSSQSPPPPHHRHDHHPPPPPHQIHLHQPPPPPQQQQQHDA